eukprot:SAG11_NODE_1983_length_3964_cov_5.135023_2_plen_67_part_00
MDVLGAGFVAVSGQTIIRFHFQTQYVNLVVDLNVAVYVYFLRISQLCWLDLQTPPVPPTLTPVAGL